MSDICEKVRLSELMTRKVTRNGTFLLNLLHFLSIEGLAGKFVLIVPFFSRKFELKVKSNFKHLRFHIKSFIMHVFFFSQESFWWMIFSIFAVLSIWSMNVLDSKYYPPYLHLDLSKKNCSHRNYIFVEFIWMKAMLFMHSPFNPRVQWKMFCCALISHQSLMLQSMDRNITAIILNDAPNGHTCSNFK